MNSKLSKVAAILAWIIGVMAVVAGGCCWVRCPTIM